MALLVKPFDDPRRVSKALERDEAHATIRKAHQQVVLEGIPGHVDDGHRRQGHLARLLHCAVLVRVEDVRLLRVQLQEEQFAVIEAKNDDVSPRRVAPQNVWL